MIEIKKLPKSIVEIEGELPAETFESYRKGALQKLGADLELPGFRKGHVPENILLKSISEAALLEEMAQIALRELYPKILIEHAIDAIGRPEVVITKLAKNNPLGFKIKTAIVPLVELPDYKAIARNTAESKEDVKAKEKRRLQILENISEKSTIDLPQIIIDVELDKMLHQLRSDVAGAGIKFEDYLKQIKKPEAEIRKEWVSNAEKRVKFQLILNKIAKEEKIMIGSKEIEDETKRVLDAYKGADPERARAMVQYSLTNEKVLQFLENQGR